MASLHTLHAPGRLLLLPCVWDAASARLFAALPETEALGTSSAAVAATHGYSDGEHLPLADLLRTVSAITAATSLPVSVDLESGYAATPDGVRTVVGHLLARGVHGINMEDGRGAHRLADPADHARRIAAARRAAEDAGRPLFINARTDVWWHAGPGTAARRFQDGVARLTRYRDAGADGVFAPGYPEPADEAPDKAIHRLVQAVADAPLNLLLRPGLPPLAELAALGVRRVSTGSSLYRLALAQARQAYRQITEGGPTDAVHAADHLPYPDLIRLLSTDPPV